MRHAETTQPPASTDLLRQRNTTLNRIEHPQAPRLLYDRKTAAQQLSISVRSLDYLVTSRKIAARRIGSRVLIPHTELVRLATSADLRSVV